MADIARLYDFQEGDVIDDAQVDAELNQLVETANGKADRDASLQDDLNADMLDGFHASETGGTGTIPVCNGDLQVDLNAEFLGGLAASDIADAGFPAGTKIPFYQAAPPAGWTIDSRPAIDRVLGWAHSTGDIGGTINSVLTGWAAIGNAVDIEVASHTLTLTEIPAHTHSYSVVNPVGGTVGAAYTVDLGGTPTVAATGTAGGGGGHTHTAIAGGSSSVRPPICWVVIGVKD